MKYLWITILAFACGLFDNSFANIGNTNILIGVIVLSILFLRRASTLNLTFAFVYGTYLRLIFCAVMWVW